MKPFNVETKCLTRVELNTAKRAGWRVERKSSRFGARTRAIAPDGRTMSFFGRVSESCAIANALKNSADGWDR